MVDQAETEEASCNIAPSDDTRDQQLDYSDPRVSNARVNDDNLPLIMSPPNMSPATLNMSSTFATERRGTGHRGSPHNQRQNTNRENLGQRLRDARIRCCEQRFTYFIPLNKQKELITGSVIEDEIRREDVERICQDPKECARWADRRAKQLFTILSYMGKGGGWIYRMYRDDISDNDLPLEAEEEGTRVVRLRRKSDRKVLPAFDTWKSDDLEAFVRLQWWVLVPKFDKRELRCREFLSETVLPLIGVKGEGAPDEVIPQMKLAGFSTVTAYRIPSAHHNFWSLHSVPEVRMMS
jgi:hypothetical protein